MTLSALKNGAIFNPSLLLEHGQQSRDGILDEIKVYKSESGIFHCPHCYSKSGQLIPVRFRNCEHKRMHFYHQELGDKECENWSNMSEKHIAAVAAIAAELEKAAADFNKRQVETYLDRPQAAMMDTIKFSPTITCKSGTQRRPDIVRFRDYTDGDAHLHHSYEVQLSRISMEDLETRTSDLRGGGNPVTWFLCGAAYTKANRDFLAKFKNSYPSVECYELWFEDDDPVKPRWRQDEGKPKVLKSAAMRSDACKRQIIPVEAKPTVDLTVNPFIILDPTTPIYDRALSEILAARMLSIDLETYGNDHLNKEGLHPWRGQIRLIQIGLPHITYIVDLGSRYPLLHNREEIFQSHSRFFRVLRTVLLNRGQKKIGHNIHFDLRFLRTQFGFEADNISCTMLGLMIFFGDYARSASKEKWAPPVFDGGYGLKNAAKQLLGLDVGKEEQKSDWGTVLADAQYEYAARDARVTLAIYRAVEQLYQDKTHPLYSPTIRKGWSLENEVILAAIDMEVNGMPVDLSMVQEQIDRVNDLQTEFMSQWREICPYPPTQRDKVLMWANAEYKLNLDSLEKAELAQYSDIPLFDIKRKIGALKAKLNNLEAFQRSEAMLGDGRIHTLYRTLTGFGRFSSGSKEFDEILNLQAISAKEDPCLSEYGLPSVRECIRPAHRCGMAVIDLAGAHARIAADQSADPVAIAGCNDPDVDNHSKVAVHVALAAGFDDWDWQLIKKLVKEHSTRGQRAKSFRDTAKNTYYGWLNGAGARRIAEQVANNTGIAPELFLCEAAIDGCKELFPGVVEFRKRLMRRLKRMCVRLNNKRYSVNRISDGFHLVMAMEDGEYGVQPQYCNNLAGIWTRIESTAVKRALLETRKLAKQYPEWELRIINYVHDEIDFEFNLRFKETCVLAVRDAVGDAFAEQLTQVKDGREPNYEKLIVSSWAEK